MPYTSYTTFVENVNDVKAQVFDSADPQPSDKATLWLQIGHGENISIHMKDRDAVIALGEAICRAGRTMPSEEIDTGATETECVGASS